MTKEKKKRSNYTEEFKRDAVALVTEQGYKISEASRSLDVGANLIGRWRRQFEEPGYHACVRTNHGKVERRCPAQIGRLILARIMRISAFKYNT